MTPRAASDGSPRGEWVATFLVILAVVVTFLVTSDDDVRNGVAWFCLAHLVFSASARTVIRRNSPVVRNLSTIVVTVVLAACFLNLLYFDHYRATRGQVPGPHEAFRRQMHTPHWPVYGAERRSRWPHALAVPAAATLLGWWAIAGGRRRSTTIGVVGLCGATAVTMAAFGYSDWLAERTGAVFYTNTMFQRDFARFDGAGDALQNYVEQMHTLSWFGQHYPPGNMLFYGPMGVAAKYLVILATAAGVGPAYGAARALGSSQQAAWWSTCALATAAPVLMLPTISSTPLVVPLSAGGLWLAALCVTRQSVPAALAAAGLGAVAAVWSFFTFSLAIWGLMLAIMLAMAVAMRRVTLARAVTSIAIAAATFAALLTGLYLLTGYDTPAAFREGTTNHFAQVGGRKLPPNDLWSRYLLRSCGNVIAYIVLHVPLFAAAILSLRWLRCTDRPLAALLVPAALVTIVIAGFSGTFTLETERIWLFFTPALAIGAGLWLAACDERQESNTAAKVIVLALAMASLLEILFKPYI